jgi:hypothetical protein
VIEPTIGMVNAFFDALPALRATPDVRADVRAGLAAVLPLVERDQAAELADLRALFELQWTRSREADARWRAEDPEARANVWPDLGVLLKWLMDDADQQRAALQEAEYDLGKLRGALKLAGNSRTLWVRRARDLGEVLAAIVDAEPCSTFDHDGDCQTHGTGSARPCPHARAKELLGWSPP